MLAGSLDDADNSILGPAFAAAHRALAPSARKRILEAAGSAREVSEHDGYARDTVRVHAQHALGGLPSAADVVRAAVARRPGSAGDGLQQGIPDTPQASASAAGTPGAWIPDRRGCRGVTHATALFSDSYVPAAVVLASSLQRHHPSARLVVLVPSRTHATIRHTGHARSPPLGPGDALPWPERVGPSATDDWARAMAAGRVSGLSAGSLALFARLHRGLTSEGKAGLWVVPVAAVDAPGCMLLPDVGPDVWLKLHAWRLASACAVVLHDADQLVVASLSPALHALELACRPVCDGRGECGCSRSATGSATTRGGPVVAFGTALGSDDTMEPAVGLLVIVPSVAEFGSLVASAVGSGPLLLCETTLLMRHFVGRSFLVSAEYPCIAETLPATHGEGGGVGWKHEPEGKIAFPAVVARRLDELFSEPAPWGGIGLSAWLTGGVDRATAAVGGAGCAVIDYQGCDGGFKPWHAGLPPISGPAVCRLGAVPWASGWNATLAWRAEALSAAIAMRDD